MMSLIIAVVLINCVLIKLNRDDAYTMEMIGEQKHHDTDFYCSCLLL